MSADQSTTSGRRDAGAAVIAYTTEDDSHAEVRQAAAAHAREHLRVLKRGAASR